MTNNQLNILHLSDVNCNRTDWTTAFKKAVYILETRGGGTIHVPAGHYATRSIQLKSNITLYLEAGAVIDFMDDYENFELIISEFEGSLRKMYMPLIYADHAENVAIIGYGTLNGAGKRWWREKNTLKYSRPFLICFQYCNRIKVLNIRLINSPVWTIHPLYCNDVTIDGISIINPPNSPNTDGINPNGSSNVRISNCFIDVGDDCIALKSGTELTPIRKACHNITITNCNMLHGHGGIVIGSEMSGGIYNVTVSNCTFQNTDRGIRIKTRRKRGGIIEQLLFQNITMDHVLCPFTINMYYSSGTNEKEPYIWDKAAYPVNSSTPIIRNIIIANIIANDVTVAAGFFYGLTEQSIENVTLTNCSIHISQDGAAGFPAMIEMMEPVKASGFFLRNSKNIVFDNVSIRNTIGKSINTDNSVELSICDC